MCDFYLQSLPGENLEKDTSKMPTGHIPQERLQNVSIAIPLLGEVDNLCLRGKITLTPTPEYTNTILPLDVRTTSI